MSDPNYAHEFSPNRNGLCKDIVSGKHCHLPEDAVVHLRWKPQEDERLYTESEAHKLVETAVKLNTLYQQAMSAWFICTEPGRLEPREPTFEDVCKEAGLL